MQAHQDNTSNVLKCICWVSEFQALTSGLACVWWIILFYFFKEKLVLVSMYGSFLSNVI